MRSLMRWSTALGIVAGSLAGAILTGTMPALALTEEQVMERLRSVPVFTITDESGSPLVAAPERATDGAASTPVAGVFISQDDAENFLNNLEAQDPALAGSVQVVPVSLAEVYQLAVTSQQESAGVEFVFVPIVAEVESAVDILRTQGQDVNEFEGVPLFIARSLEGEGGFLTIESGQEATAQGEQERFIPIFFQQTQIESMLARLTEAQPSLANSIEIQVINLEGLIETLQTSDNDELNRILLIPPTDSLQYILDSAPQPQ
ncbi:MAG: hypothetical protein IGR80_06520 [Synechococcales cyanobacterium K44_A2020_017]|nr:hypothetical protein [Synechococcales cyanobacterium K32_A2020_035]MBF2094397.1 hypothetical protein [Synechococcales cyanobacterium K44_A2020_017]